MAKMPILKTGKGGWTEWIAPPEGRFRMGCCDCDLVHDHEFRVVRGAVEFRVRRNGRSTGQARRWSRKVVVHK